MSDLSDVFSKIQKAFKPRKTVDFNEYDLHVDIESLNTIEEVKVLEAIKDLNGAEYLEAIKRHTLAYAIKKVDDIDLDVEILAVPGEDGKVTTMSKYLYMRDYLGTWPSSVIDVLFDVYSNIQIEVDAKIRNSMKFERFMLAEAPVVEEKPAPNELRPVQENDEPETEAERLQKQVNQEIAAANEGMANAETEALDKLNK